MLPAETLAQYADRADAILQSYRAQKHQILAERLRASQNADLWSTGTRLLRIPLSGYVRKSIRSSAELEVNQKVSLLESLTETELRRLLGEVQSYLSTLSIQERKPVRVLGSLVQRLYKAQGYARAETRISKTSAILRTMEALPLVPTVSITAQPVPEGKEVLIQPGKPFTGKVHLKGILASCEGFVKIIDPYVAEDTLDLLLSVKNSLAIQILTSNLKVNRSPRFYRACVTFKDEKPHFSIRCCSAALIHDRFIVDAKKAWKLGSSLKDFGRKLTTIDETSTAVMEQLVRFFDETWNSADDLTGIVTVS